jgi:hypothetical protein
MSWLDTSVVDPHDRADAHHVRSWSLVTLEDRMVHPHALRYMAQRACARTTEVAAAHSVLRTRPEQVAAFIRSAATERTHP